MQKKNIEAVHISLLSTARLSNYNTQCLNMKEGENCKKVHISYCLACRPNYNNDVWMRRLYTGEYIFPALLSAELKLLVEYKGEKKNIRMCIFRSCLACLLHNYNCCLDVKEKKKARKCICLPVCMST